MGWVGLGESNTLKPNFKKMWKYILETILICEWHRGCFIYLFIFGDEYLLLAYMIIMIWTMAN